MNQVSATSDGGEKAPDLEKPDAAVVDEEPDCPIAIETPEEPNDADGQPT